MAMAPTRVLLFRRCPSSRKRLDSVTVSTCKRTAISHGQKSNSVVGPRTGRVGIFPRDFGSPKGELIFELLRARPVLGAFFFGELLFKLLRARPVLVFVLFILW